MNKFAAGALSKKPLRDGVALAFVALIAGCFLAPAANANACPAVIEVPGVCSDYGEYCLCSDVLRWESAENAQSYIVRRRPAGILRLFVRGEWIRSTPDLSLDLRTDESAKPGRRYRYDVRSYRPVLPGERGSTSRKMTTPVVWSSAWSNAVIYAVPRCQECCVDPETGERLVCP